MSNILSNDRGNLSLELKEDRLSAWLTIKDSGILVDEHEILELIERAGIKTGFEEALKYMRKNGLEKEYGTPFPIAICNHVKSESHLHCFFDQAAARSLGSAIRPELLKDLACVEKDAVIADYSTNIFDRQGSIYDIFGNLIHDEELDPSQAEALAGDRVRFDPSRQQFIAETPGFVTLDEQGRMSILDSLVHEGDVDAPAEGLRAPVSLTVQGSVSNTSVAVKGNLTITGDLVNSSLYCEGDLEVKGAIRNCRLNGLEVLGSVQTQGIAFSRILCLGRLVFESQLFDSEIVAEGGISSERGSIEGGHAQTCGNIAIANLGNLDNIPTELEITIGPFYKTLLMQLTKQLIHLKQEDQPDPREIGRVNDRIRQCEEALDQQLNEFLQRPPSGKLSLAVREDVFPPVRIRILKHEYQIKNHQNNLMLTEKD
jgi:uncharacterized protein (DUF342 family)